MYKEILYFRINAKFTSGVVKKRLKEICSLVVTILKSYVFNIIFKIVIFYT